MKFLVSFIANSGLHTPHKNGSSKCSILGTFLGSLEIHGRTRCVTTMSSQELVHVHISTSTPSTLAGLCSLDGRWTHPQRIYVLYGELATTGARLSGRLRLRFKDIKDICKRGMKACNLGTNAWKTLADNRNLWKQHLSQGLKSGEAAIVDKSEKYLILDICIISHSGLAKQKLSAVVYIQIPRKTRGNTGNKMFSILWSKACGCCLQYGEG